MQTLPEWKVNLSIDGERGVISDIEVSMDADGISEPNIKSSVRVLADVIRCNLLKVTHEIVLCEKLLSLIGGTSGMLCKNAKGLIEELFVLRHFNDATGSYIYIHTCTHTHTHTYRHTYIHYDFFALLSYRDVPVFCLCCLCLLICLLHQIRRTRSCKFRSRI